MSYLCKTVYLDFLYHNRTLELRGGYRCLYDTDCMFGALMNNDGLEYPFYDCYGLFKESK
jgi:hypothetical protein